MSKAVDAAKKSSKKARSSAARLAATQAVYQMLANEQAAGSVIEEYVSRRLGQPVEGQAMVMPDGAHFKLVVAGVADRRADLEPVLAAALAKRKSETSFSPNRDPLLHSLLLCGAYELLAFHEIDAPIIISDYVHVANAFFEHGEAKLVNAILDQARQALRDS